MKLIDIQNKIRSSERHDVAQKLGLSKEYVDQVLRGYRNNEDVVKEASDIIEYRELFTDWQRRKYSTPNYQLS